MLSMEEIASAYKEKTLAYIEASRQRLARLKVLLIEVESDRGLTNKVQFLISDIEEKISQANKELGVS